MLNKKAKGGFGIILILIILGAGYYFFIYQNGIHNPFNQTNQSIQQQTACVNSGGKWFTYPLIINGINQNTTKSSCGNCPSGTFTTGLICSVLTQNQTTKCIAMSNNGWNCALDQYNFCMCRKLGYSAMGFRPDDVEKDYCACKLNTCGCYADKAAFDLWMASN